MPKRSGPRKGANEYEAKYLADKANGFKAGVTIAEYEAGQGWPLFTIWPEAETARGPHDTGWFLYTAATSEEERAEVSKKDPYVPSPRYGCVDCGSDVTDKHVTRCLDCRNR